MNPTPDNFQVSDISKQVITYCEGLGHEKLAEYFLPAFKAHWRGLLEQGKKPKWTPNGALKNWVRRSSPNATREGMFKPWVWEAALAWCKTEQYKETIKVPVAKIKTTPKIPDKRIAYTEIARMFKGLKTNRRTR